MITEKAKWNDKEQRCFIQQLFSFPSLNPRLGFILNRSNCVSKLFVYCLNKRYLINYSPFARSKDHSHSEHIIPVSRIESNSKGSSFRIISWQRSDVYSDRLRWALLLVIFAGVVLREKQSI